jgi:hypothetical protein
VTRGPWRVILDLGAVKEMRDLEMLFQEAPWTNMGIIGSVDAEAWFDYKSITNDWVSLRYLYLNFLSEERDTNPPAIREIIWRER